MWGVKSQKMNGHATSEYHVMSLTRMEEFINRYSYPSEAVNTKSHKEAQAIIEANQKVVESLIRVVMVCGKQVSALCGHHDDKMSRMSCCSYYGGPNLCSNY